MPFEPIILGKTGLKVGRLGIGSSYGVPAEAIVDAFHHGVNYLYWGALRRKAMAEGIRRLAKNSREQLVIVLQFFARFAFLLPWSVKRGLKELGLDYADVLLFGTYRKRPAQKAIDTALELKEKGLIRYIGLSSHNRPLIAQLSKDAVFDLFHIRYNAVHRGAEKDIFPFLPDSGGPGIVAFTATSRKELISSKRVPKGEKVPAASDCYRFVLSNPAVHICITGPKNRQQMQHALQAFDKGPLNEDEMAWMKRVGDYIYGKK